VISRTKTINDEEGIKRILFNKRAKTYCSELICLMGLEIIKNDYDMNNLSEEFVEISKGFFSLFNLNKTKRR
jgi:hypothetical protein